MHKDGCRAVVGGIRSRQRVVQESRKARAVPLEGVGQGLAVGRAPPADEQWRCFLGGLLGDLLKACFRRFDYGYFGAMKRTIQNYLF